MKCIWEIPVTVKRKIASFRYLVRHRMLMQRLRSVLSRAGIEIYLLLWIEESIDYAPQVKLDDNIEDYSFEFLRPDEMKNISWLKEKQSEDRLGKLEEGFKCLGVKYKGEIIGYTWAEPCKCSYAALKTDLRNNEAYLFDMHVSSSFRGRNVAPYLRIECYKALKSLGYDTCYSICDYFNTPSIKFKKKLNVKFLNLRLHVKLFKKFGWVWKLKEYKNWK
ncbi:MAG: GNAT family N-acetyltransferase [Planctomycetota bacterium]|nr:GNAT family N-acetyltransferase [Planctomycetota bacterium]